jgi:hypothetical protein
MLLEVLYVYAPRDDMCNEMANKMNETKRVGCAIHLPVRLAHLGQYIILQELEIILQELGVKHESFTRMRCLSQLDQINVKQGFGDKQAKSVRMSVCTKVVCMYHKLHPWVGVVRWRRYVV